jgi:hypothetical protein
MVQVGDRFRCADQDCACEVEITKPPKNMDPEDEALDAKPLCLCGEEMEQIPNSSSAHN